MSDLNISKSAEAGCTPATRIVTVTRTKTETTTDTVTLRVAFDATEDDITGTAEAIMNEYGDGPDYDDDIEYVVEASLSDTWDYDSTQDEG